MDRKSVKPRKAHSPAGIGITIGAIVGLILIWFSVVTALGICSDTSVAETLFPYSMILLRSDSAISAMAIIALVQYPIYALICGSLVRANGTPRYWVVPILLWWRACMSPQFC